MTCLNVSPSAPDTLNQLAGLSDWLSSAVKTVAGGVSTVGSAISSNSGAIVNLLNAYGTLQAQKAGAQVAINQAQQNAKLQAQAAAAMTPAQWSAYQAAGGYATQGLTAPSQMPSWVLPVGLGAAALVLVMLMTSKRGANG